MKMWTWVTVEQADLLDRVASEKGISISELLLQYAKDGLRQDGVLPDEVVDNG